MREDYSKVFTSLHNTLSRSTVINNSKISPFDVVRNYMAIHSY